ncbi:hypothetical protein GCM10012275_10790 [Longimycelium tulufanense]|uniref:Uncharacterized protein n=1 Tax=Longimycelium tulufanense TaxID=907463 RepID=A0A8J3FSR8_9PSEU|nr:hypothetical protein GCM10012275_10790 [Longimycelium tulufanense]
MLRDPVDPERVLPPLGFQLRPWRRAQAVHDAAKVVVDLALAVALGGDCAADIALLRAQPKVFGQDGLRPHGVTGDRRFGPGR